MVADPGILAAGPVVVGEDHPSNRDLDGFAAALSGNLGRAVARADGIGDLPPQPPACLLFATGISAQGGLEAAELKFGPEMLRRSIPIGVSSHGAELAIAQWGALAAIDFWGFACWSAGRRGDNGVTGLIVREAIAERLGFTVRHRYAGLAEVADKQDLAWQTARVIGLVLDDVTAPGVAKT